MTYRDDTDSLRAEVLRLRADNAALRAKPARVAMRWTLSTMGESDGAGMLAAGVLCAWCSAEAIDGIVDQWAVPSCGRRTCSDASSQLFDARMQWCMTLGVGGYTLAVARDLRAVVDEVIERDAREMRGDPPDMTGWLLW